MIEKTEWENLWDDDLIIIESNNIPDHFDANYDWGKIRRIKVEGDKIQNKLKEIARLYIEYRSNKITLYRLHKMTESILVDVER